MSKKKEHEKISKKSVSAFLSVLALIVGVTLAVLYAVLPYIKNNDPWGKVCLYGGLALAAIGIIGVLICIAVYRRADKREERARQERLKQAQAAADAGSGGVTYIPATEAANIVTVGTYQTLDEKFAQIAKMDKTQFVIYIARLFSRKGYQVKLTPVIDNHDIDLLVEKMGVIIAVGCLLTNRVLCKEDIVCVRDGRAFYGVNNCMALTNMYFDRTALEFAQAERMSLVDRNVLADDFMN